MRQVPRAAAAVLLVVAAAGCAARQPAPAPLDPHRLERRYAERLDARRALIRGTLGEVSLWLETAARRYPGAHATYGLGGADTMRVRVASSFGTALDLTAAGDSLWLWVPSERAAVRASSAEPPLDLPAAAAFAVRVATAAWPVPAAAWRAARPADTLTVVRWVEAGDTLELEVGTSGLPRRARLLRPGMRPVRVTYLAWRSHEGTPWPERIEVEDEGGALRLSVRVRHTRRVDESDAARWRALIPDEAEQLDPEALWKRIGEEWSP